MTADERREAVRVEAVRRVGARRTLERIVRRLEVLREHLVTDGHLLEGNEVTRLELEVDETLATLRERSR